jgi:putative transcriptional regulator
LTEEDRAMRRLRLKADGRIVELTTAGNEAPLAPARERYAPALPLEAADAAFRIKALRSRAQLTQTQLAKRLGVPVETIRNWEQGKRLPRGPARALLRLIENAPDAAFAMLEEHIA